MTLVGRRRTSASAQGATDRARKVVVVYEAGIARRPSLAFCASLSAALAIEDPLLVVSRPRHLSIVQPLVATSHVSQDVCVAGAEITRRLDLGVGTTSIRPHVVGRHVGQGPRHPIHLGASICAGL